WPWGTRPSQLRAANWFSETSSERTRAAAWATANRRRHLAPREALIAGGGVPAFQARQVSSTPLRQVSYRPQQAQPAQAPLGHTPGTSCPSQKQRPIVGNT